MDINAEIWKAIDETPKLTEELKKSLHVKVMRIVEASRRSPAGKKLGVTVMTQEGSLGGDAYAANRKHKGNPGDPKPKSI